MEKKLSDQGSSMVLPWWRAVASIFRMSLSYELVEARGRYLDRET